MATGNSASCGCTFAEDFVVDTDDAAMVFGTMEEIDTTYSVVSSPIAIPAGWEAVLMEIADRKRSIVNSYSMCIEIIARSTSCAVADSRTRRWLASLCRTAARDRYCSTIRTVV